MPNISLLLMPKSYVCWVLVGGDVEKHFSVLLWAKIWTEDWSLGPSWTTKKDLDKYVFKSSISEKCPDIPQKCSGLRSQTFCTSLTTLTQKLGRPQKSKWPKMWRQTQFLSQPQILRWPKGASDLKNEDSTKIKKTPNMKTKSKLMTIAKIKLPKMEDNPKNEDNPKVEQP